MRTDLYVGKDYKTLYQQLIAGFYDALVLSDPDGHILDVNPRVTEYFIYDSQELSDQPISVLIPGVTPTVLERLQEGLTEDRRLMLNAQCRRKDDTEFAAEISISTIDLDTKGNIVFSIRNIDRRKKQWQFLRSKANAFDIAQSAVFCCDTQRVFRAVNQAFLDMFGFSDRDEVIGRVFEKVLSDEPLPELLQKALEGVQQTHRLVAESQNGMIQLEFQLNPDRQEKGKIVGVVGSIAQL